MLKSAPITKVGFGTYLLKVNLRFTAGARFNVEGLRIGGTTNELRLTSNNSPALTSVVSIGADHGTINFNHTKVTSWDTAKGAPDTEYAVNRRAYVNVRSRLVGGVKKESRMDVQYSDVSNLGYFGAEAYGLAWKVMDLAYNTVDVRGNIKNSRIHHNYFGAYTFGAYGMNIDSNEFDHNVKYGLDPHDDSDFLTINNNYSHDNGNHGIICSQRCNNLNISNNRSENNVGHGIMLHREVVDSKVTNNTVSGNRDAGIALFESSRNIVQGNKISGGLYGIRLSMGSSANTFGSNTISASSRYGIYTYTGTDLIQRPGNDKINRGNIWNLNSVKDSGTNILKLTATDQDRFTNNTFSGTPSGVRFDLAGATRTTFTGNSPSNPRR